MLIANTIIVCDFYHFHSKENYNIISYLSVHCAGWVVEIVKIV